MNKDIIKYGLLALGAYLVYKYVQDQGGLSAVMGIITGTSPAAHPPVTQTYVPVGTHPVATTPPVYTPPVYTPPVVNVPILDLTGLVVARDINDSLAGTVKIAGQPIRLAIITSTGGIYDNSGQEVSATLAARGVDLNQLRTAFQVAGMGLSGFAPTRASAYWLN